MKLNLNLKRQSMVIEAMGDFRRSLRGDNKEKFDKTLDKVKAKMKHYNKEEMVHISQALHKYSKILYVLREDPKTVREFRKLGVYVEELRMKHHPFKRKEASTAVTVDAS